MAAEHVTDKEIVKTITVNVCKINSHGVMAGAADSQLRESAEMAPAIVDPDSIRTLKIVADIDVWKSVAVHVAEHDGEAQIPRRFLERLAVCR